jgi:hypothetical protein
MQFCFAKLQTSSAPFGGTFPKGEGIGTLNSNLSSGQSGDILHLASIQLQKDTKLAASCLLIF